MRTKLHSGFGTKEFPQEEFELAFQVRDADVFVHIESFDLMKLCAMGRVDLVPAISRSRSNHPEWRQRGFHRADLHGCCVRSQKPPVGQIKRVLLIAGRVVWWRIQSIEAVPLRFDIRTFGDAEAHSPTTLNRTLLHLVKRMQRTDLMRRSWK